jgi:hypothetical protein
MPTFKKPSRGRHPKTELHWTTVQRKLLAVLEQPEHRRAGPIEICATSRIR